MKVNKAKVVVIVGPTASGKTALSLTLAKKYNGEIISADSRQIYRGMDIGTAKAPIDKSSNYRFNYLVDGIKHHLVDIKNPNQNYSVAEFKKDAIKAISQIHKCGRLPIVVGGTGLYISALADNLKIPPIKENKKLRAKLEKELSEKGLNYLFKKLVGLDSEAAYIVDSRNPRRVIRALEVALITGKPFTSLRKKGKPLFNLLMIGINSPNDILKKKITERIKEMTKDGLVKEVKNLVKKYGFQAKPFDAIGYREIIEYIKGKISLEEAIELMIKNTWHYAKRQITWFKKDKKVRWLESQIEAEVLVKQFLNSGIKKTRLWQTAPRGS